MNEDLIYTDEDYNDTQQSAEDLSRLYERQSRRYDSDLDCGGKL